MRAQFLGFSVLTLLLPTLVHAQEAEKPKFLAKIDQVRVGFRGYHAADGSGQFKVGMWAPVYVDVTAGLKGVPPKNPMPYLEFECTDSEGIGTFYRVPVTLEPNESRTFIGYVKPGNYDTATRINVSLHVDDKTIPYRLGQMGAPLFDMGAHMYLSLGSRIPDLREALLSLAQMPNQPPQDVNSRDTAPRYAAFETDPQRLPELWFGYQNVDLLILNTDKKEFLTELLREANRPRLKAIAQWVRRGGRLVIPVNHLNQDLLEKLLQAPVWQPLVPVVPPANPGDVKQSALKRLAGVEQWVRDLTKPFPGPGEPAVPVAKLNPGQVPAGAWEVHARSDDGRPLLATMPYGMGNITYIAFSLDQPPFTRWDGRVDFLKTMVNQFAHTVSPGDQNQNFGRGWRDPNSSNDVTTGLQQTLDNFDVNVVPFGYVALFIILYIIVVGPLDYFILKHVFHKLEWTWVTFPVVVLAVSVAAYFTAYALKGNDLKVNKVDVIDFDLRTELDGKEHTSRAYAYGQSFFTVLSPRIQNYTVGVEPNPAFWGGKTENPLTADQVSWLGRPEFDGPGAMGRSGSQGFFRRPYSFAEDARGVVDVPIPVWTTKSFNASWEAALPKLPFQADLTYHTREFQGKPILLTGTIKNNLPVDLEDVWIFFGEHCFPLGSDLPASTAGGEPTQVMLHRQTQKDILNWVNNTNDAALAPRNQHFRSVQGAYNPTSLIRQTMFFDKINQNNQARNHSLRFLDFSWRLQKEPGQGETRLREAILYAHVPFERGQADVLNAGLVPTRLWLGRLPEAGKTQPTLAGTMAQDTYIRVVIPVRLSPNN